MKKLIWTMLLVAAACSASSWANEVKNEIDGRRLFTALRNDNIAFLERNLERLPDLNFRDKNGNTLIHALVAPGQVMPPDPPPPPSSRRTVRGVDRFGQRYTIVDGVGQYGTVATVRAMKPFSLNTTGNQADDSLQRRMKLIHKLAARGLSINSANARGQTPLHLAAQFDSVTPVVAKMVDGRLEAARDPAQHRRFVEFLIGLGADPALADSNGCTPVFLADNEMLLPLLGRGAALDARDKDGLTPFLKATPPRALALMRLGADPHAVDAWWRNRWFHLHREGWKELALQLHEQGVDSARTDKDGRTALMTYCSREDLPQALFLLDHGADPAKAGKDGRTPLHLAAGLHNPELLALLLERGAAADARDSDGETPLFAACRHRGCVELLMSHGADAAIANRRGQNVLHRLAGSSDERELEMLAFFIARKVPLNQQDGEGKTPLAIAYERPNIKAMKLLLENGANPDPAGYGDWSLLDRAEEGKKMMAVELLRMHGARHGRSWASRYRMLLFYVLLGMGIFPLFVFVFGLLKPALFKVSLRRIMPALWSSLGLCFLAVLVIGGVTGESDYMPLFLILALPLLGVLLISLVGIQTLVERVSPGLGIFLSLLTAAGCPALTYGILWLISSGFKGEGGTAFGYMLIFGANAATVITLAYALFVWIKTLKSKSAGSEETPQEFNSNHQVSNSK